MKNKFLVLIIFILICLAGGYFFGGLLSKNETQPGPATQTQTPSASNDAAQPAPTAPPVQPSPAPANINSPIKLDVPFVVQAPFGNWSDPIFENACEEASIVMAMSWINGAQSISPAETQKQILDIVNFENKTFGYNYNTDVFDVQKIFQQYFHRPDVSIRENITVADIRTELQKGNLVLAPAFGQTLGNPNYTAPGPITHMLVIIGYDPATKEFITNDTGTRHGANYRYAENVLFSAIWKYPSGKEVPPAPTGILKKTMIIVPKK